ncbi:MAG: hypothetical protein MUC97_02840 [Bernardetiaceae bacterium]|nr:hypothetical protein [Bernardetiaceae bacterium]
MPSLLRHTLAWLLSVSLLVSTTGRPLYRHFCSVLGQPATVAAALASLACPHAPEPAPEACCLPSPDNGCPSATDDQAGCGDDDCCKTEKVWQHTEPGPLQSKPSLPTVDWVALPPPVPPAVVAWAPAMAVSSVLAAVPAPPNPSPPKPGRTVLLQKQCWQV